MEKRAAIYVRISTDRQTIENQLRELRQIAERRGWEVVHEYHDAGISGSKQREARPGLDEMLNDAQKFLDALVVLEEGMRHFYVRAVKLKQLAVTARMSMPTCSKPWTSPRR